VGHRWRDKLVSLQRNKWIAPGILWATVFEKVNISMAIIKSCKSAAFARLPHTETLVFMEEPKGWRELQQKALEETDTQRLIEIVDQLTSLLTAHEKKVADAYARGDIREDVRRENAG
jgi:hypothetical protein